MNIYHTIVIVNPKPPVGLATRPCCTVVQPICTSALWYNFNHVSKIQVFFVSTIYFRLAYYVLIAVFFFDNLTRLLTMIQITIVAVCDFTCSGVTVRAFVILRLHHFSSGVKVYVFVIYMRLPYLSDIDFSIPTTSICDIR